MVWGTTRPAAGFPGLRGTVTAVAVGPDGRPSAPAAVPPAGADALLPVSAVAGAAPVTAWTRVAERGTALRDLEVALGDPVTGGTAVPVPGTRGRVLDDLAAGPDGTLVVHSLATPPGSGGRMHVRRPDGVWEPPVDVVDPVSAAVAPDGTVAVLLARGAVRVRTPDGRWAPAVVVRRGDRPVAEARVVAGPDGTLTAAWTEGGPAGRTLVTSARPPGGRFARGRVRARGVHGIALAAGAHGTTVAWGEPAGIRYARRSGARGWSAPRTVPGTAPLCAAAAPDAVAAAPDGSVTLAWPMLGAIRAAVVRPDGTSGPPVAVARTSGAVTWLGAASDAAGVTTLAWMHAGRVNARGQLIERLAASVAAGPARSRPGTPSAASPVVRALRASGLPGGRVRVRVVLARAGTVQVAVRDGRGPIALSGVPVRLRGRAGANVVTVTAPPALRGRGVEVEAAPAVQPTCAVGVRVRTFR